MRRTPVTELVRRDRRLDRSERRRPDPTPVLTMMSTGPVG